MIAAPAGRHHVFPHVRPAPGARHHVIPGQFTIGKMLPAIEAVVLIPAKQGLIGQRGYAPRRAANGAIGREDAVEREGGGFPG